MNAWHRDQEYPPKWLPEERELVIAALARLSLEKPEKARACRVTAAKIGPVGVQLFDGYRANGWRPTSGPRRPRLLELCRRMLAR